MSEPVLRQPDQTKPFKVKVDASNYTMGAVLMQRDEKNVLHPIAFFSKSMNEAQCNSDIYNKELLGLREMLHHWCQYLFQPQHKVWICTDHTNLLFWKNPGEHNRRVVRWHAELMEYDFELVHIAGARNGRADALSRRPDYDKGEEDNKKLVVLPERFFAPNIHACLAGTEWANPNNPEDWQRFVNDEDNVANYQSIHDQVMADQINNNRQPLLKRWSIPTKSYINMDIGGRELGLSLPVTTI